MCTLRALLAFLAAVLVMASSSVAGAAVTRGGGGDPYFPRQGNGGFDVSSYAIAIGYTPKTKRLTGKTVVHARATQRLKRFDLDLRRNVKVSAVAVDGHRARFAQPKAKVQELVITPRHALRKGHRFAVTVRYAGTARPTTDPDGSADGFIPTDDGAFVASEPQGSPTWFPVNDTPRDKARYRVSITVPKGLAAISNGKLVSHKTRKGKTTWKWRLDQPVSSYLVTATIGKFTITTGRTKRGIPYLNAVDPREAAKAKPVLAKLPGILDWLAAVYGRYPFGQAGAIVDHAPQVGYALETATRPVFDRAPDADTLAHELAHQWFGDDVTLRQWRDIWLNEGWAEFSAWLYEEHVGGRTTSQHLTDLLKVPASETDQWDPPPGNPGSGAGIFAGSVYDRGAGTLAALRERVGSKVFFAIARGWLRQHPYGNATVGQFIAYAQRMARRDLRAFFADWLYEKGKPSSR